MIGLVYVESIRNLPPLVLIFIFYFFVGDQIMSALGVDEFIRSRSDGTKNIIAFLFATRALEMAARKGVATRDAAAMARAGLDSGLAPEDFEPLGKSVVARVRQGMRGRELAAAIHQEVRARQQHRWEVREREMRKQGILEPTKAQSIHRKHGAGEGQGANEEQEEQGQSRSGRGKGRGSSQGGR